MEKIAIIYQANLPPKKDGIQKPMKPTGYSDSGADIAFELHKNGINVVTPSSNPNIKNDYDWVFPDTESGIQNAINKGANRIWLNTVLYKNHAIEKYFENDMEFIGQLPKIVDEFDDKFFTNELLRKNNLMIPESELISSSHYNEYSPNISFPLIIKPLRGRGSQGVELVNDIKELKDKLNNAFKSKTYGNAIYIEQFLSGQEITVTVMPKGIYNIKGEEKLFNSPWCLPAVRRFNHIKGVAPYNGVVAVINNSELLSDDELETDKIKIVYDQCIKAAELIHIMAPIRIDCRADENGKYYLFDLNMKPNMTGPSRPHRKNQDSLTLMAAKKIGWTYFDLLLNILNQSWKGKFGKIRC